MASRRGYQEDDDPTERFFSVAAVSKEPQLDTEGINPTTTATAEAPGEEEEVVYT